MAFTPSILTCRFRSGTRTGRAYRNGAGRLCLSAWRNERRGESLHAIEGCTWSSIRKRPESDALLSRSRGSDGPSLSRCLIMWPQCGYCAPLNRNLSPGLSRASVQRLAIKGGPFGALEEQALDRNVARDTIASICVASRYC